MAVNGDPQDGLDAADRARSGCNRDWHPILALDERRPGEWWLKNQYGTPYAIVRLLRVGGEQGYRAVTWAERSEDRVLIGYFRTLKAATFWAHRHWLRTMATPGRTNRA